MTAAAGKGGTNMANKPKEFTFKVREASSCGVTIETVKISTIQELYMLAVKYGGDGSDNGWKREIQDLVIQFINNEGEPDPVITIYDDWLE